MRKVVIDTNVLVSALLSSHDDSATVIIVSLVLKGCVPLIITSRILAEYEEVLRRRKFRFPEENVSELLDALKRKAIEIDPVPSNIELLDEDDRPFFDAMLSVEESILITGNIKHFPRHERIMTGRAFLSLFCQS